MTAPKQRFLALDVFRGMTICFMIIVNTPGSQFNYSPLEHSHWNGFTPTDLVFPSFLFAVGNAMSFVMSRWDSLRQSQVLAKIFKRTFIIFLCGFLLYWFPFFEYNDAHRLVLSPFSHTRIMGVLQRQHDSLISQNRSISLQNPDAKHTQISLRNTRKLADAANVPYSQFDAMFCQNRE